MQTDARADPFLWSVRTMLPSRMKLSTPALIDGVFGAGFFDELRQLPTDVWAGPVESGYGVHLVRINETLPARVPALEEVHDAVLREWKAEKATELREQVYSRLLERYSVELPEDMTRRSP
jgi:hypothetical protein